MIARETSSSTNPDRIDTEPASHLRIPSPWTAGTNGIVSGAGCPTGPSAAPGGRRGSPHRPGKVSLPYLARQTPEPLVTAATDVPAPAPARVARRSGRRRRVAVAIVLLLLVVAACLASIAVGTRSIGMGEVWRALSGGDLTSEQAVIVRRLRVPRTALGLIVGLALGV